MPAYMVITAKITDRENFLNGYGAAASTLVAKMGGKYVLRAPGGMSLEGEFGEGASMAISEWPSKEAALKFWNSSEYQEIKKLREGQAECQVVLIEADALGSS